MTLKTKATSILGYRVLPTSILALVVYVGLFVALIVTDVLSDPPSPAKRGVLDLRQAYEDLRHITAHPHPYNSHANDRVRSYILERLQSMKQGYTFVHVVNDTRSNGSWASEKHGVYFEGSNILVKIDGTSSSPTGGVLFSAHFDSVSTAPGATDDGMGVATLLQLVNHFSINRMPRTAVFNINNGEEDWLNGAHAFLEHPWSNLTDIFLNLEGAAAGGRPILFRATSTSSVKAFRNTKLVPHPHGNVLSSDGFARGLIRSGTDFSVYATPGPRNGMDGLDLAFYKGRSKYHTKYDAVPFVMGGENSLWSMMETARGVGENLLSAPVVKIDEDGDTNDVPVYFDLFKSVILVFPISGMLTFNVVTLIIGPIALVFLALCDFLLGSARKRKDAIQAERILPPPLRNQSSQPEPRQGTSQRHVRPVPPLPDTFQEEELSEGHHFSGPVASCLGVFWRNIKFWVALVIVLVLDALLAWGYVLFNPFAIYSLPYTVLFAFLSLSYLVLTFVLTLPSSLPFYHSKYWFQPSPAAIQPAQQQKYSIFVNLYIFTWILLVFSTLGITKLRPGVGGGYLFSAWNICVAVACILLAVESIVFTSLGYESPKVIDEDGRQHEDLLESNRPGHDHSHRHGADSDERTPLLARDNAAGYDTSLLPSSKDLSGGEDGGAGTLATWCWIPQFLVSVPLPVTLFAHVTMIVLDGMAQTLADGPSPWTVYIFTALLAVVIVLPLAPFSYKLRPFRPLTFLVVLVFVLSTVYTWLVFPFTPQDPLKIYFQQVVVLPTLTTSNLASNSLPNRPRLTTVLLGPERYLRSSIIPTLPSSHKHGKVVNCSSDTLKLGLTKCEWESGPHMRPNPGSAENTDFLWKRGEFLTADIRKTGHSTARIRVKGKNTRSCRLYFDSRPIFRYDVVYDALMPDTNTFLVKGMQKGYEVPPSGVKEVRLWSRTWENEFIVDVDWSNSTGAISAAEGNDLEGRIACEWNEYESAMVDNGPFNKPPGQGLVATDGAKPKIPALEEVLNFLPDWAVVSKAADGLVEVWAPFTL